MSLFQLLSEKLINHLSWQLKTFSLSKVEEQLLQVVLNAESLKLTRKLKCLENYLTRVKLVIMLEFYFEELKKMMLNEEWFLPNLAQLLLIPNLRLKFIS